MSDWIILQVVFRHKQKSQGKNKYPKNKKNSNCVSSFSKGFELPEIFSDLEGGP